MSSKPDHSQTDAQGRDSHFPRTVSNGCIGEGDGYCNGDDDTQFAKSVHHFDGQGHTDSLPLYKTHHFNGASLRDVLGMVFKDRFVILLFGFSLGSWFAIDTFQSALNAVDFTLFCKNALALPAN